MQLIRFGLMPLIAYFYANVFNFSDEHAIGLMLIASAPGGVTSNLITYWSGGDVMLSITMSAVSTILAFGMMPLLIEIYINTTFADGGLDIPYQWIFITLLLLIIPCAIGVWVRAKSEVWAKRMEKSGDDNAYHQHLASCTTLHVVTIPKFTPSNILMHIVHH